MSLRGICFPPLVALALVAGGCASSTAVTAPSSPSIDAAIASTPAPAEPAVATATPAPTEPPIAASTPGPIAATPAPIESVVVQEQQGQEPGVVSIELLLAATLQAGDAPIGFEFARAGGTKYRCPDDPELTRRNWDAGQITFMDDQRTQVTQSLVWMPGYPTADDATQTWLGCVGRAGDAVEFFTVADTLFADVQQGSIGGQRPFVVGFRYEGEVLTTASIIDDSGESERDELVQVVTEVLDVGMIRLQAELATGTPELLSPEFLNASLPRAEDIPDGLTFLGSGPAGEDQDCHDGYVSNANRRVGAVGLTLASDPSQWIGVIPQQLRPDVLTLEDAVEFYDRFCIAPEEGQFERVREEMHGDVLFAVNRELNHDYLFMTAYRFEQGVLTFALGGDQATDELEIAMIDMVNLAVERQSQVRSSGYSEADVPDFMASPLEALERCLLDQRSGCEQEQTECWARVNESACQEVNERVREALDE